MGNGNGLEVKAFGISAALFGAHVVATIVLVAGIAALVIVTWFSNQAMLEQSKQFNAQVVANQGKIIDRVGDIASQHRDIQDEFQAMLYVLSLSDAERHRLNLQPPRALRLLMKPTP